MATESSGAPTMTDLVKGIVSDVGDLIRHEVRFARKEITSDLRKTRTAVTFLLAGSVTALVGLIVLSLALGHLLHWATLPQGGETAGLPLWAAHGIVSLVLIGAGSAAAWAGVKRFETFNPLPDKTVQTLQENVTLQENASWTNSTGATTASSS